ncbi:MAG TPA: hypothetical protein VMT56_00445 [Candidatus Bathyarchaeia archaeon]|nr:hypothetical protein [Candidatus Bathyarchaeia archaeon]
MSDAIREALAGLISAHDAGAPMTWEKRLAEARTFLAASPESAAPDLPDVISESQMKDTPEVRDLLRAAGKMLRPAPVPERETEAPSEAEIAEWEKLANEATPGPWVSFGHGRTDCTVRQERDDYPGDPVAWCGANVTNADKDGPFIAAARTAVPRLIAALRAARRGQS